MNVLNENLVVEDFLPSASSALGVLSSRREGPGCVAFLRLARSDGNALEHKSGCVSVLLPLASSV